MQYAWRKRGRDKRPHFAILLARVSVGDRLQVLDAEPVTAASAVSPACVNHPALAAGPRGECLLAYEHDAAVDRCLIVARMVKEE